MSRLTASAIKKYFKGRWDNVSEKRIFWEQLLKRSKSVTHGNSGLSLEWAVEAGKYTATTRAPGDPINHSPKNHLIRCTLPWSMYYAEDSITKEEKLMNRGNERLTSLWDDKASRMADHFEDELSYDVLNVDGSSLPSGYVANAIYGAPSFLSATAATSTNYLAVNNDTYAGHSTAAAGITGIDNPLSDAWQPTVIDYTYNSKTWAADCQEMMRRLITNSCKGTASKHNIDMILLTREMYLAYLETLDTNQRFIINNGAAAPKSGFKGVAEFDGVQVYWDQDMPANVGYGFNFDHIYMECLDEGSDMFDVVTDTNTEVIGETVSIHWRGQLRFNPRYQGKLASIT